MPQETKTALTRESCQKELADWVRCELARDLLLLAAMVIVFCPLFLVSLAVAGEIPALGVLFAVLCAFAPSYFICKSVYDLWMLCLVARGGFSLVRDRVRYTAKGETPRKPFGGNSPVNVLYFEKYGRYVPSDTVFAMTSVGDEFILAVLSTKKTAVVFAFHTAIYTLEEKPSE